MTATQPARYVPAGTRGVLTDASGSKWFTCKKEVDMTHAAEAVCPLTGRRVLAVTANGFTFHAAPESVCLRRAEIPQMSILNYDVSDDDRRRWASGVLLSVAVRTTWSGWVVPTAAIPWTVINRLREAGDTVTLYKYDPSEGPALLAAIENTLKTQIREAGESAERSAETAAEQYANSDAPNRGKYFEQRIKTAAKQAQERLGAYQKAAAVFGFNANALGRIAAAGVAQAAQANIYLRAQKYVEARATLAATNTQTAQGLAAAAADDTLPAEVMADALRDHGHDEQADQLQAAFAGADDGVFSLDGAGDE